MKTRLSFKIVTVLMVISICSMFFCPPAAAAYSVGFYSAEIQIIDPPDNGAEVNGVLPVSGNATISKVWFCIRSPQNEVTTQFAEVTDGKFKVDLQLRFGPGKYTIWAGNNQNSFDGKIRFIANNIVEDNRFTSSSAYIDSNDPAIIELSQSLIDEDMNDMEKVRAFHEWVAGNIVYDYQGYLNGNTKMKTASTTLIDKKGVCTDYSFLLAALCRAADIPAKVVFGQASNSSKWAAQAHAWNEVLVDGKWIIIDAAWDAGYIKEGAFVSSLTYEFFNPSPAHFARTHTGGKDMLY